MSSALNTIASRLLSAATFGYGLFTMLLYGLLAIRKGYFFKGPSEKENLELQLGMTFLSRFHMKDSYHCSLQLLNILQLAIAFGICQKNGMIPRTNS